MKAVHWLLTVAVAWWFRQGRATAVPGECQHWCGDVRIPYPFGLETNCVRSADFLLNCTTMEGSGVQLLAGNLTIRSISVGDSTMVVSLPEAYECYNQNGVLANKSSPLAVGLPSNPRYRISETQNKLTVLGCDALASVADNEGTFGSGCISYCGDNVNFTNETTCSGQGCCQASIPKGLTTLSISINFTDQNGSDSQLNRCARAFVVDNKSFNISNWTLPSFEDVGNTSSLVLDWMVESNVTCQDAKRNNYACGSNTTCKDFISGYRCVCKDGYEGNPYNRIVGCTDIDECKYPKRYPCHGKCRNQRGSYDCWCGAGRKGKGKERCKVSPLAIVFPVLAVSFFGIPLTASVSITMRVRLKRINFGQNGGEFFLERKVRIFPELELAKATNNYDYRNKLSDNRFSSIHRGTIAGDTMVVVKKPKDEHKSIIKGEFQHELEFLMKRSHRNVVKLKGICLETRIPLLVYEYIPNGTLFQHIHQKTSTVLKSWEDRFRIAAEVALALDHMHSQAEPQIVHGNIKSANILLDQKYSAKLSDFGTSVLISPEHRHIVATQKKDSLGYIDPEYLITGELTTQSDVYSFGVVLVELLTRKKPNAIEPENPIPIIHRFITSVREMRAVKGDTPEPLANFEDTTSSVKGDTPEPLADVEDTTSSVKGDTGDPLSDVIDFKGASAVEKEKVQRVAEIAERCLERSGANRPPMSEVAQQLADITTVEGENGDREGTDAVEKVSSFVNRAEEATSSCLSCLGLDSDSCCI
ncbi:hypothetical protein BT93_F0039 [Corymbia citriodora subsp. variegata]|nr:hypothetical protein BT93_F0039 [Corymbia citriodora subsp. variegata]